MSATGLSKTRSPRLSGKLLPLLFNTLILAGLLYLSVVIGSRIMDMLDPAKPEAAAVTTAPAPQPEPADSTASEDIAALHLFGTAEEPLAEPATPRVAPETKLDLTLRGIFAGDGVNHGFAIIQNNRDKEERYFTIQQHVFRLATLEEIHEDRVILLHNGRYETLFLPKESLSREHFYDSAEIRAEKKRVATNYRDRFLRRDGMDLIKLFGFKEAYKAGSFAGFRVTALGEEGLDMMKTLGIEDGDLVTVLNGKRFSEGLEAFEEIKKLKTATSFDIIIDRNGNEIPFHFELEPPVIATDDAPALQPAAAPASSPGQADIPGALQGQTGTSQQQSMPTTAGAPAATGEANDTDEDWDSAGPGRYSRTRPASPDADADLGEDWDASSEAEEYRASQQERITTPNQDVEYDH